MDVVTYRVEYDDGMLVDYHFDNPGAIKCIEQGHIKRGPDEHTAADPIGVWKLIWQTIGKES